MNLCAHLQKNNQNYFAHLKDAMTFSVKSLLASGAFFVHAIFPFALQHTGSSVINSVHDFIAEKDRKAAEITQNEQESAQ